jgi:hypothetical protein
LSRAITSAPGQWQRGATDATNMPESGDEMRCDAMPTAGQSATGVALGSVLCGDEPVAQSCLRYRVSSVRMDFVHSTRPRDGASFSGLSFASLQVTNRCSREAEFEGQTQRLQARGALSEQTCNNRDFQLKGGRWLRWQEGTWKKWKLLPMPMPSLPSPPGCSFLLCGSLTAINFSRSLPLSARHRRPHIELPSPTPALLLLDFSPKPRAFISRRFRSPLLALEVWHFASAAPANSGSG